MKKAFTLIEIIVVFLLILLVTFLSIPLIIDDSKKAGEINVWRHTYSDILYAFKMMDVQKGDETFDVMKNKIQTSKSNVDKENILAEYLKPYFRIVNKFEDKSYVPRYLNSQKVLSKQYYYFDNFYITQTDTIIGIKWIGELYDDASIVMLMFDTNGAKKPNKWGRDIFGINLYKNKIEPLGENLSQQELNSDCSKKGRGVYCSFYYLMGAQF